MLDRPGISAVFVLCVHPDPAGVHVLDLSAGAGWLGLFTALHSSSFSVTCVEAHPAMARICRRNAALSGVADRVSSQCSVFVFVFVAYRAYIGGL